MIPMKTLPVFGKRLEGCTYVRRPSAYALLCNTRGEWAVVRTQYGCYLPGGGAERNETPQQTVEREALEECGFVLKTGGLVGSAIQFVYSLEEKQYFEKICEFVDAEILRTVKPTEPDHELLWTDQDQALSLLSHEAHRWAIVNLSNHRG